MIMGQFSPWNMAEKKTYATVSALLLLKQTSTVGNFFAALLYVKPCSWLSMLDSINWCISWTTNWTWKLHSWGLKKNRIVYHSRLKWLKKYLILQLKNSNFCLLCKFQQKTRCIFSAFSQFFWTKPNQSKYTKDNVNNLERFFFIFSSMTNSKSLFSATRF